MNKITERIFKNYKPDFAKLQEYGFTQKDGAYFYTAEILDGQFILKIKITDCDIDTQVIDTATDEPYTLFLADGASGSFVGTVKSAYESVLLNIAEKCFDKRIFKSDYAQKIIEFVAETYGDSLEFLWEKFTDNAIWRRKDNKKWYGLILTVAKNKIGLQSEEKVEIIDLRVPPEDIDKIIDGKRILSGYHMNKKHWVTICLDGSVPLNEIENMLNISYGLAKKP